MTMKLKSSDMLLLLLLLWQPLPSLVKMQNFGYGKKGVRLHHTKFGQSARVRTGEGIGKAITPIHIGDR